MIVKLTSEQITKLGAKDPADASVKLAAFFIASAQLETVMAEQPTLAALETRIAALEKLPAAVTEARVKEIVTAESSVPIKTFISSVEGKQLIGAEASRITMEALSNVGTIPAKPSPAAATPTAGTVADLEAAGEYEKSFALLPESERADFLDAKSYASFQKANRKGAVQLHQKN